jgi:hypothetical protein
LLSNSSSLEAAALPGQRRKAPPIDIVLPGKQVDDRRGRFEILGASRQNDLPVLS